MVDRVQLTQTCYMQLDGQWQLVYPGAVMDVATAAAFNPAHVTVLSPGEAAGALASHGKPTPVRNIRKFG